MTEKLSKASRALIKRSLRLLDMEYKPSEIAEELATDPIHILRVLRSGAPARKDSKGRYWVHGTSFASWLQNAAPKNDKELKERYSIADNEIYCLVCKEYTTYTEYRRVNNVSFGTCLKGHKVSRFISNKTIKKGKVKQ